MSDDMPGGLMMADANFPRFTGTESTEQKLSTIQNYLFQLTEQLRWAYANIGKENFNETEFDLISEEIAGPVVKKYESLDLTVTDGDENSNSATIQITGDGLKTEAKTIVFKGMVTFGALGSDKGTDTGKYTVINGAYIKTGEISAMTLTSNTIKGNVIDGNTITGNTIEGNTIKGNTIEGNTVKGNTVTGGTISGTEISGGTITGTVIRGTDIYCGWDTDTGRAYGNVVMWYNGEPVGGLMTSDAGAGTAEESRYRVWLYAQEDFVLKLESAKGISIESDGGVYLRGGSGINLTGTVRVTGALYVNGVKVATETTTV